MEACHQRQKKLHCPPRCAHLRHFQSALGALQLLRPPNTTLRGLQVGAGTVSQYFTGSSSVKTKNWRAVLGAILESRNPYWSRVAAEDEAMNIEQRVARKRKATWQARFVVAIAKCNKPDLT
jgi:hypothetical protein